MTSFDVNDPKVSALRGDNRTWWDLEIGGMVPTTVLYLAQGCPDWGELHKPPHNLCTFCALPHAARSYRTEFFGGRNLLPEEHLGMFAANLTHVAPSKGNIHTVIVFNAGSFLSDLANPPEVQEGIARLVADHATVRRLVIESRAELITDEALIRLTSILRETGKELTVRIGVETQDEHLRLKVLRKGHTRRQLLRAVAVMREQGVTSGGYTLLNPASGLDPEWSIAEAENTIQFVLGELGMDEAYFRPTCVGPGTLLEDQWRSGAFKPASLWATWKVLSGAVNEFGRRVHLLPFHDEPEFLAVPSNHTQGGIPQSLVGAAGCDLEFHALFQSYREGVALENLQPPTCSCRSLWL